MWQRVSFRTYILVCLVLFAASPALALSLETPLSDSAQESRAKALFDEIRCVVCQGETIADSPADVAKDLRREIRDKIAEGESNDAIKTILISHYGDGILMRPPFNFMTSFLWMGPLLVLFCGLLLMWRLFSPRTGGS